MNKKELINKLLDYKQHNSYVGSDCETVIGDIVSDLCDYNSDNDYELDSYTYKFDTIDGVEDFLGYTIKKYGILELKNRLSDLRSDGDWFIIDDVDGTIYNPEGSDVEEWINDILDALGYEQNEDAGND